MSSVGGVWTVGKVSGNSPFPRTLHTASEAAGKIILIGGKNSNGECECTIYVLNTAGLKSWNLPRVTGVPPTARHSHSATIIDNKLYLFGGYGGRFLNDWFVLNCGTFAWSQPRMTGIQPLPRSGHTSTPVGANIYLFGGCYLTKAFNDLILWDTVGLKWETIDGTGEKPTPRYFHVAQAIGNTIYIFGGTDGKQIFNDLYSFDTQSKHWTLLAKNTPIPPSVGAASVVINNRIFIFGGFGPEGHHKCDALVFSPEEKKFFKAVGVGMSHGQPPSPRDGHTASFVSSKVVYFLGGDGPNKSQDVFLYNPGRLQFNEVTEIEQAGAAPAAIMGGSASSSSSSSSSSAAAPAPKVAEPAPAPKSEPAPAVPVAAAPVAAAAAAPKVAEPAPAPAVPVAAAAAPVVSETTLREVSSGHAELLKIQSELERLKDTFSTKKAENEKEKQLLATREQSIQQLNDETRRLNNDLAEAKKLIERLAADKDRKDEGPSEKISELSAKIAELEAENLRLKQAEEARSQQLQSNSDDLKNQVQAAQALAEQQKQAADELQAKLQSTNAELLQKQSQSAALEAEKQALVAKLEQIEASESSKQKEHQQHANHEIEVLKQEHTKALQKIKLEWTDNKNELQEQIDAAQAESADSLKKVEDLQQQLLAAQGEKQGLASALEQLSKSASADDNRLADLQLAASKYQSERDQFELQVTHLHTELDSVRAKNAASAEAKDSEIQSLKAQVASLETERDEKDQLISGLRESVDELDAAKASVADLSAKILALQAESSANAEQAQKINALQQKITELEAQNVAIAKDAEAKSAQALAEKDQKIQELEEALASRSSSSSDELDGLRRSIELKEQENAQIQERSDSILKKTEELSAGVINLQETITLLNEDLHSRNSKIRELEEALASLNNNNNNSAPPADKVPASPSTEGHADAEKIAEFEQLIEQLHSDKAAADALNAELDAQIHAFEQIIDEQSSSFDQKFNSLTQENTDLIEEVNRLNSVLQEFEVTAATANEQVEALKAEVADLHAKLNQASGSGSGAGAGGDSDGASAALVQDLQRQIHEKEERINHLEFEVEQWSNASEQLQKLGEEAVLEISQEADRLRGEVEHWHKEYEEQYRLRKEAEAELLSSESKLNDLEVMLQRLIG